MGLELQISDEELEKLLRRLRRLEGQVRGVQRMIERRRDCEAIMTQLAAMKAAIHRVAMHLVSANMEACMSSYTGIERERRMRRLAHVLAQF